MEVAMQEQDKLAVESMCRCGLDLEGVINVFLRLPREEIVGIYKSVIDKNTDDNRESNVSINCT